MNKLMQNRKKGFTLVELIVVIVIIAILVAALTPAILGVIRRANISSDEGDARAMLIAVSAAATLNYGNFTGRMGLSGTATDEAIGDARATAIQDALGEGRFDARPGEFIAYFRPNGVVPVSVVFRGGTGTGAPAINNRSSGNVMVGVRLPETLTNWQQVSFTMNADGTVGRASVANAAAITIIN
ncbi:MAG: prepilin-type N-terminal cleavage/methylation domain-containing protein [Defluviitaleaceae bacterium]|nr:prepilin-type N-terminal cleavage/methylation domain-containing protein [Defluviitaleaceae bacterium]